MTPEITLVLVSIAGGAFAGIFVGRLTGKTAAQVRELEATVEELHKECECRSAEIQAAKDEIQRRRQEIEDYRGRVAQHFSGSADRFRDMVLQYRDLFDHLADGARELCPDGLVTLEGGVDLPALLSETQTELGPTQGAEGEA